MIDLLERPVADTAESDEALVHLLCCTPDVALCGKDVSDEPFVEDSPDDDVCVDCQLREALGPGCPACDGSRA